MKKALLILIALVLALSLALSVMAEGNAARQKVTIRFAQYGNSTDDVDGMENDPIKKAIEEAVNVELEYDTGTDGFVERMETELFTGGAAELFCSFGETTSSSRLRMSRKSPKSSKTFLQNKSFSGFPDLKKRDVRV